MHLPTIKQHMASDKLPVTATPQDADGAAGDRRAHLRRQRRRHDDRHDQAEGDVRQRRSPAVAGPVRARHAAAHDAAARDRRADAGGADRPGRPVRLRRQAGFDRRAAAGHDRRSASSDDVVVEKGLKPGETVVTEGQLRLEPGTRVHDRTAAAARRRRTRRRRTRRRQAVRAAVGAGRQRRRRGSADRSAS